MKIKQSVDKNDEEYILGQTGDFEHLRTQNDDGLVVQVYLNKKKDRIEYWHINPKGEYFVKIGENVYIGVRETERGWVLDEHERLLRIFGGWGRINISKKP